MYDYYLKSNPVADLLKECDVIFTNASYKAYNPNEFELVPKRGYIEKQIQNWENEKDAEIEKVKQINIRHKDYCKRVDDEIAALKKKL